MEYIKNTWYVAGWASEFGEGLRRVTLLERHLVMYRASTGHVIALEDRCPHRLLPLSMGQRIGDDVQCGYHGMTFDCSGKCVRVPGQDIVPAQAYVETFPIHEKHDIVWIWMGEKDQANVDDIFDMAEFYDDKWDAHQGDQLHLKSNYLSLVLKFLIRPLT